TIFLPAFIVPLWLCAFLCSLPLSSIESPPDFCRKDENCAGVIQPQQEEDESAECAINRCRGLSKLQVQPKSPLGDLKQAGRSNRSHNESGPAQRCGRRKPIQKEEKSEGREESHNPADQYESGMKIFFEWKIRKETIRQVNDINSTYDH